MIDNDNIEEIRAKLPWYVNGTLDAKTRQSIDDAIASSPALKAEVEWLKSLQSEIASDDYLPDIPNNIGFDQFKTLINNEQSGKVISISSRWQQWQRPLMAVAATLVVVQMGVIGSLLNNQPETITTLSGSTTISIKGTMLIQVVFNENATTKDTQAALQLVDAEIVGGPSALGIYVVRVSDQHIADTIARLRKHAAIDSVSQIKQ